MEWCEIIHYEVMGEKFSASALVLCNVFFCVLRAVIMFGKNITSRMCYKCCSCLRPNHFNVLVYFLMLYCSTNVK